MRLHLIVSLFALSFVASCASMLPSTDLHMNSADQEECVAQPMLICVVKGTAGNDVEGYVTYRPVWMKVSRFSYECNVRIRASITGLSPGKHGFHIHTYGDISAADGTSTGGHFVSASSSELLPHALPRETQIRHWGALGNIFSNEDMMARYSRINKLITIQAVIGRGMTIHAGKDKGSRFQPSGNAGPRVATCVIGIANPDLQV